MSIEKIVKYLLILAVFVTLVIIFIIYPTSLKNNFLSLIGIVNTTTDVNKQVQVTESFFYNSLIQDYKRCKLSTDDNCVCALTNPYVPPNHVLQFINNQETQLTEIVLIANAELNYGPFTTTGIIPLENKEIKYGAQERIQSDRLFIAKNLEEAQPLQRAWLSLSRIYSEQDIAGTDYIDLSAVYKRGEQSIFIPKELEAGQKRCTLTSEESSSFFTNFVQAFEKACLDETTQRGFVSKEQIILLTEKAGAGFIYEMLPYARTGTWKRTQYYLLEQNRVTKEFTLNAYKPYSFFKFLDPLQEEGGEAQRVKTQIDIFESKLRARPFAEAVNLLKEQQENQFIPEPLGEGTRLYTDPTRSFTLEQIQEILNTRESKQHDLQLCHIVNQNNLKKDQYSLLFKKNAFLLIEKTPNGIQERASSQHYNLPFCRLNSLDALTIENAQYFSKSFSDSLTLSDYASIYFYTDGNNICLYPATEEEIILSVQ